MQVLAEALGRLSTADASELLALVGRIDLAPGTLAIRLDGEALAGRLGVDADRTDPAHLVSEHPFTLSKRGVETKLVLGEAIPARRDETLVRNIAFAHAWFERLKGGTTVAEIAEEAGTSRRRVQQIIELAFLAPDIVVDVLEGRQPLGFTSDWCLLHSLPPDWDAQRALIATL